MEYAFNKGADSYAIKSSTCSIYPNEVPIKFKTMNCVKVFFSGMSMKIQSLAQRTAPSYCCHAKNQHQQSLEQLVNSFYQRIMSGDLVLVQKSRPIKETVDPLGLFEWNNFFNDPRIQADFHTLPTKAKLATIQAWQREKSSVKILEIYRPTDFSGPSTSSTIGVGFNATAGTGKAISYSKIIVSDLKGNTGYLESKGAGGMGGSSVSATVIIQVTNAKELYQLKGLSVQTGGSFGQIFSIGFDYLIGDGYSGVNFSFGVGKSPTVVELHSIAEYASVNLVSIDDMVTYVKKLKN